MRLVYLAGSIMGKSYKDATDWRQYVINQLYPIRGVSPLRGKDFLKAVKCRSVNELFRLHPEYMCDHVYDCGRVGLFL